ncbi:MAG: hypothetical protein LW820_01010 [Acidibacter sp.]|jgi:hypothetical protein|nr:hypothetical protein [Acidibacter sp.]
MNTLRLIFATLLIVATSALAQADDIDAIDRLSPSQFESFADDLVAALSYKSSSSAEPLGVLGFDLGLGVSLVRLENAESWGVATGSTTEYLPIPKVSLSKGLPFDVDLGAFVAAVPGSNILVYGGQVQYALMAGNPVLPAVAVRGGITRLSGVEQLALETRSVELVVSKGLFAFTPYAGIGRVWGDVTPNSTAAATLQTLSPTLDRIFAGLQFGLVIGSLSIEVDKTGDALGASTKLGLRF